MALAVCEMRSRYEVGRWEKWPLPAGGQLSQRAESDASKDVGPLSSVCLESSGNWELGYSYVLCFLKHFLFVFCQFSFECACWCWLSQEEMRSAPVCRWDPGGREGRGTLREGLTAAVPTFGVCAPLPPHNILVGKSPTSCPFKDEETEVQRGDGANPGTSS